MRDLKNGWVLLAALAVPVSAGASGLPLAPSIQFGTLPSPDEHASWQMAIPIDGVAITLETEDSRFAVRPSPMDGGSWLVFSADRGGPASGLLNVRDREGRPHAISVAADVARPGEFRGFLLRGQRPGDRIERYVRRRGATLGPLRLRGARVASATEDVSGWTRLRVQLSAGAGECDGTLEIDHAPVPVHVSLLESITVRGAAPLDPGFEPVRVGAIGEQLQNGRLSARIGVLGHTNDTWRLRTLDAQSDGPDVNFTSKGFHDVAPLRNADDPGFLSRVAHLGGEATSPRFFALTPGQATLVDPLTGPLASFHDASLLRIGAARASRFDENRMFAITGRGNGEWFLTKLLARRLDGQYAVRRTRYLPSLQSLLSPRNYTVGSLASIVYPTASGPRENLLVTLGDEQGLLRVVELEPSGTSITASVRHRMQLVDPRQLPAVQGARDVLPSKRAGSSGLPIQVRLMVPNQEVRVLQVDGPGRWSFLGREELPVPLFGTGVALARAQFLVAAEPVPGNTQFLGYSYDPFQDLLQGNAVGAAPVSPVDYRASARGLDAWMVGNDVEGRGSLLCLTNGLPAGTNLPPVVSAGPDILTSINQVRLRASVVDANGDPVAVRWIAPGVEFTDRFARRTTARVPQGRTRIRVRAREGGFAAPRDAAGSVALEDADVVNVRYEQVTDVSTGETAGLVTALGRPEPNPSASRTWVPFTLAEQGRARVDVFDLNGRLVRTLLDQTLPAGGHDAVWDGAGPGGMRAAVGIYFIRLAVGERAFQRRIVLVR